MTRAQLNIVLGAFSVFVTAFYLGFNVSYRMASGTIGGTFGPALLHPVQTHAKPASGIYYLCN
jgi:hypothetical protein